MHLFIACVVTLAFAIFLDWSRVRAGGVLFVLKDYVRQVSSQVTLKRVIYIIGIILFVLAASQALGFDWAFISIGGDTMLYFEIVSTVYLVVMRGFIQQIARIVVRAILEKGQKTVTVLRSRSRERRSPRHHSSSSSESDDDAEPAMVAAFALA